MMDETPQERVNRLQRELAEAQAEAAQQETWQRMQRAQELTDALPSLLVLLPKHDRTSCDDGNMINAYNRAGRVRCRRCEVLYAMNRGSWDPDRELELSIS